MSKDEQGMPFVPEEDLNLHEDFKPIIAENGIIRPKPVPDEEFFTSLGGTFTRMDTIQDLVELRTAEEKARDKKSKEGELPQQPPSQDPSFAASATPADSSKPGVPSPKTVPTEGVTQSLPELPHFVQPASADVATKGRGKKRILTTVARKTILRLKKKRLKKKKIVDAKAAVPPKNPQKPVSQPLQPTPKKPRRWPWVVAVLCFLFLGGISSLVPVEKIPMLRNLAYAMGFDKTDTARMSFLRALLTWTDKYITLPGFLQPNEQSRAALWARLYGNAPEDNGTELAGLQGRMASTEGKTSLIDMQTLHALQRQKGRTLDEVRGSVMPIPGQEEESTATLRDNNVNVRTEASQDKSDVFFGSDTSVTNRTGQEGYDSVNTLKKLANPYITDGHPIDWLTNTAKRLMKADMGLGGINRGLSGTQVNWATDLSDIGEQKPNRDLYHAWITSRMSKYTSNVMLKKSLADSSFLGAEIPSMASSVWNVGGIQVDMESLQADQQAWKEYQEWERKCKQEIKEGGGMEVTEAVGTFNSMFSTSFGGSHNTKNYNVAFPQTCEAVQKEGSCNTYSLNLASIQQACQMARRGYDKLSESCGMDVPPVVGVQCYNGTIGQLTARCKSFKETCKKCKEEDEQAQAAGTERPACIESDTADWKDESGYNPSQTEESILGVIGGKTDYFPQIVRGERVGVDAQGLAIIQDKEGEARVKAAVKEGTNAALISPF